ncbi:MAG: glycosyltransferase, partial [Bacteroidota bacterium]
MSKKKVKTGQQRKVADHAFKGKLSIVVPCYNESKRLHKLLKALKSFDQSWGRALDIILVDDGSHDDTAEQIKATFSDAFSSAVEFQLLEMGKNGGKGRALQAGVEEASGDFILTMDADVATHPKELQKWLSQLPGKTFDEQQILIASREHQKSKVSGKGIRRLAGLIFNFTIQLFTNLNLSDTQCGFKLYPAKWAKPLFANLKTMGWAHDVELLYAAHLQQVEIKSMPVKWDHQEDSKISLFTDSLKMFWETIRISARLNWNYFVTQPIKDLTSQSAKEATEPSYYRLLFALLALVLFIAMPMLSYDYGITGDEEIQKIYGEKVLDYFEKDDQSALDYKNLYYYGGMFDYYAAKLTRFFTGSDVYEIRHVFNAFVGFLLMLFTGFLAKEITGSWRGAFFGLLFIALTPRIFGHSMNNPKDIPFAAAYAFTLLYLIRFTKQLPKPSTKTILF